MPSEDLARLRAGLARRETVFDRLQLADQDIADVSYDGLRANPPQMLMLRQSNFSGATLRNWTVSAGNMMGSSFQETKLDRCTFTSTQFQGSDFFGASFRDCQFTTCYMFEAFYSNAKFVNCTFMQTSMKDSVMSTVTFQNTNIEWLKMDGVQDATRRASARLDPKVRAKAEDAGAFRNHIDQASLDLTLTMMAARRRAMPEMQRKTLFGRKSLAEESAKHFNSPADIEAFLRTTTLSSDQIRTFINRFKTV